VQRQLCSRPVSLGSFSEAQHVLDPALLAEVFRALAEQVPPDDRLDPRLSTRPWLLVDSTLWEALPRMRWALWRHQHQTQRAVRLHLGFHLLESRPARVTVTAGHCCERAAWRAQWESGDCYVGDRYYGEDYAVFSELQQRHCAYVIRLRQNAVTRLEQELPLSQADRQAQVPRQAWVRLGARGPGVRVRVVWVQTPTELLWLATNLNAAEMSAELVAQLYRCRWQVELFFRWIKCILENRHWLAESESGVRAQVYLALIAALLLQLFTGRRPTRRMLELIQWYLLGWASVEELTVKLERELARQATKKRL
jgi:hypothetical protein